LSVVANTTVISNFASAGQLDLLRQLFDIVFLSTEVYQEIQAGLEEGYRFYEGVESLTHPFASDGWLRLTSMQGEEELRVFSQLPGRLHSGEASCIAVASQRDWTFLSDDLAARGAAAQLGIRVSGSLGCLVLAIERGHCSLAEANTWLQQMVQAGYHSPVSDLRSLLSSP
jgi:predicted nucleic acid-binding protein